MASKVAAHMHKQKGGGGGLSAHIERQVKDARGNYIKWLPKSVTHPERTKLNKDYILAPGDHRSAAIEQRIREAGIKRKVSDNQVKCLAFIVTSDHDKMVAIEKAGRLDEWARDQVEWFKQEFGAENVVGAALHMDEKTPHLHISVVPIIERARNRTLRERVRDVNGTIKRYAEKEPGARLSAKDICTRPNLIRWQDELAKVNAKWGMERGEVGSSAKHVNPADYNAIEEEMARLQDEVDDKREELEEVKNQVTKANRIIVQNDKYIKQQEAEASRISTNIEQMERQRKEKAAAINKENGNALLAGLANVVGKGKYADLAKENEQLKVSIPHKMAEAKAKGVQEGAEAVLKSAGLELKDTPHPTPTVVGCSIKHHLESLEKDLEEAKKPKLPSVEEQKREYNRQQQFERALKEAAEATADLHNLIRVIGQNIANTWNAAKKAAVRLLSGKGSTYTTNDEDVAIKGVFATFGRIVPASRITETLIEDASKEIEGNIDSSNENSVRNQFNGLARRVGKGLGI